MAVDLYEAPLREKTIVFYAMIWMTVWLLLVLTLLVVQLVKLCGYYCRRRRRGRYSFSRARAEEIRRNVRFSSAARDEVGPPQIVQRIIRQTQV